MENLKPIKFRGNPKLKIKEYKYSVLLICKNKGKKYKYFSYVVEVKRGSTIPVIVREAIIIFEKEHPSIYKKTERISSECNRIF